MTNKGEGRPTLPEPEKLSVTAYCILGLLALRDWTTYELAEQMRRGVGDLWTAARSMLFVEPKNLAARGLAEVRQEPVGRRPRAVYSITPAGQRALQGWLSRPGAPPLIQFEGGLKVLLADRDDPASCRSSIAEARRWAEELQAVGREVATGYLDDRGPFQDRVFQVSLTFEYLWKMTSAVVEWADWAEQQLSAAPVEDAKAPFRRALAETRAPA